MRSMLTNMDPLDRVRRAAESLRKKRTDVFVAEMRLQDHVSTFIEAQCSSGGLREWARSVGITPGYAVDLRYKRRKISESMLEKILGKRQAGGAK